MWNIVAQLMFIYTVHVECLHCSYFMSLATSNVGTWLAQVRDAVVLTLCMQASRSDSYLN